MHRPWVLEGGGFQRVEVTAEIRGNARSGATVVSLAAASGTAIHSQDFNATTGVLSIPAGRTSGTATLGIAPINDRVDEGDETLIIRGSTTLRSLNVQSASITITDDDTAGVAITPNTLTIDEGASGSHRVALLTKPSQQVTVTVTGQSGTDLTLDKTTLTFTTSNWGTPQAVTVTAGPDTDGTDDSATLTHTAAGGEYQDVSADLAVTVVDIDRAIVLTPSSLTVEEEDATGKTYTVKLASEPSEKVTVTVTGQSGTDLTLTGLSTTNTLTFTTDNWDTAQTVTVKAAGDAAGANDEVTLTHTAAGGEYDSVTADLAVTVVDNDRAIVLTPSSLEVEEEDATGETYTVKLATEPSEEVTITVSGQSGTEVSVDDAELTFSTSNWDTAQTVTVKAAGDTDGANDEVTLTHTAAGGNYESVTADLAVTVDDYNPPTGVNLTVSTNSIGEAAGETNLTVTATLTGGDPRRVDTEVTLSVAGVSFPPEEDDGEATIAADSADFTVKVGPALTIPAGQIAADATIAFTPTNDNLAEGDETAQVSGISDGLTVVSAPLTIVDNDPAPTAIQMSVSPTSVREGDGKVNIDLTATLSGGSPIPERMYLEVWIWDSSAKAYTDYLGDLQINLIIPAGEMSGYYTLEFTILDDDIHEPTERFFVGAYNSRDLPVRVAYISIIDDDKLGLDLSKSSLTVDEEDETGETYTVKLESQPSETVTVTVSGQAGTELTLAGLSATNTLTFSTSNWNTAQTVTVKATGDTDGANDEVTLTHTSAGGNYAGVTADLSVTVDDDETVAVVLSKSSLSVTEEDATGETYTVKLSPQPSEQVTVTVTGQSGTDLTLDKTTLTFTTSNWNTAQTVMVKAGHDTDGTDDPVTLTHTAAGGEYQGATTDLSVTALDNDRAIVLSPSSLTVDEEDAAGETYTVKPATEPSEEVTVAITGQSGTEVSVDDAELTFTTDNWDTAQTVTVKAGGDTDGADDKVTLTHTAAGGNYAAVTADLAVTVDDETLSVVLSETALSVTEEDTTGETYTVKLSNLPSQQVTVTITGQAGTELTLDKTTLTFTTSNWNTAQTVTVNATNDTDGADDPVTLTHTASGGGEYEDVSADLAVTVVDDDRAIVLTPTSLTVEEEDATGETYTVKLATEPSAGVTVTITGQSGTELSVDDAELTFTTDNWDTAQTVTVKAGGDTDGADEKVTLTHTAAGGNYAGVTADLAVTVADNETVSVVLSETSLSITEEDATGETYTVKLSHQPSEQVTVTVTGQTGTELTLDKTALTFTTSNWNTVQTVTVKATGDTDGADDPVTLAHTAAGREYDSVTADLAVTVVDNDRAIVLTPTSLTVEEEDATGETYMVKLATDPSEEVTITVSGQSGTEVSVDDAELTFTTSNWNTAQTVTVKAAGDTDGANDEVTLTHTAAGGNYAGVTADLAVTVDDDETVSVVLSETALSVTEEDATGETYTVKLSHQPSEQVTGQSGTELTLDKTALTFTTSNWNTAQPVTVKATNDADGVDDPVTLTHTAAGGEYQGATTDLSATVDDDETVVVVLSKSSLSVTEEDTTGHTYTVKLATEPSEEVTVTITGQTGTELTLDKTALTFTTSNWNTVQTVTVKATNDTDGADDPVTLTHTASGGEYDSVTATLPVTVTDNDRAIVLTPTTLEVDEEDATGKTYTVKLATEPSEEVTVTITGQSGTEVSVDDATLTFTTANWNTTQTVTVTATDESDDSVTLTLTHTAAGGNYEGVTADLVVTVDDDETGRRVPSRQVPGSGPVTNCYDADQYWEEDVEVGNNGQELPDQANNADGYVPFLQVGQTLEGYIGPCDDWDLFRFELEEDKYYRVDFLGSSTLDGTLRYPNLIALLTDGPHSHHFRTEAEPVWYRHSDGKRPFSVFGDNSRSTDTVWVDPGAERQDNWGALTESNSLGGVGSNARQYLMRFPAGTYYVALIGGYNIGTYRIRLTEVSDDDSGIRTLTPGDEATGRLDFVGDKDVFDLELVAGKTYDISIQKKGAPWRFSSAPFVGRVEDVDASAETNFPFTRVTEMRHFTFYAATTGNHRFTVQGHRVADRYFADGGYGLTVTEHVIAPSAPRNLTVSSLTHDSVTLTWEAPEDSVVDSYQVLRRFLDDQEFGDNYGFSMFVPIADDISSAETTYTDTSVEPRTRYAYRVKARNAGGLGEGSSYANAVTLSANRAATGMPIITGPPTVGRTLTADTTGITDEDGLTNVSFSYQWLADDADIAGATSATYTVQSSDNGKILKVRVSFIDDVGNEESLTSAATAAVSAAVPSMPLNVAVERGGTGELDVSWVRPDSDGGSEITGYTVQWKEASGSWDTAADVSEATVTDTSYTITGLRLQVEYAVRVFATNSAGDGPASAEVKETVDAQTSQQQGPVKKIVPVTQERNTLATGAPSIVGTLVVGQTLSVNTSSISDDDGLDNATFVYQWLTDDTDISGATGPAYILADSDQGKAVKVRVSFTDDAGNDESLTSEALVVPVRPHGLTATASEGDVVLTWTPPVGFSYLYDYQILRNRPELGEAEPLVFADTGNAETTYTDTDVEPGVLYVYRVKAASYFARFTEASEPVEIRTAEAAANTPATGAPAISGDLVVGRTLSADTSAIEDDDGLTNPAFVYQWLADDTDISGATASSYTLVDSDEGKAIKVTVSFTDAAGNGESLSSAATASVAAAATPLTAEFLDTPSSHDGETAFTFELRFSEEFELSYKTLRDHAFTVTGGEVTTARRLEEPSNIRWEITVAPDGNGSVTVVLPATTDCTAQGAICTGDRKMLSGEASVTVAGPEGEEQQTPPENTPATGAPAISGTAQVGETLTADTSGIADSDGTDKAAFAYQWLADDADISGATGNRYTLTDSEEAKAIKVRVSFTDDEGNEESLTSDATAAVEAAPVADTLVSFTLVDTSDHSEVATLADGMSVTLDEPANGSYGIRVEVATDAEVGSVFLELTGPKTASQTENIAPYSLYGDNGTDLNGEGLPAGSYTLRATAYSESGGGGDELQALEVSFTVSDS